MSNPQARVFVRLPFVGLEGTKKKLFGWSYGCQNSDEPQTGVKLLLI